MAIDSTRVQNIVDRIDAMTASDMKTVAKFGKVKGYSQEYADLKEALRLAVSTASSLYGINLLDEFSAIDPISFTGMIPNDYFNSERRKIVDLGERLATQLSMVSGGISAATAPTAATGEPKLNGHATPKIFVSGDEATTVVSDLSRCLLTADCEIIGSETADLSSEAYVPGQAIEQMKGCNGAMICLLEPLENGADEDHLQQRRQDVAKTAMVELGVALGRFPEKTFFVVQDTMLDLIPQSLQQYVSFRATGEQLSFEEGQRAVLAFKRPVWANS